MATTIEKTGKTIEDALRAALEELGARASDVEYEVLEEPRKGILGIIGTRPAKLRVTVKEVPAPAPIKPQPIETKPIETKPIETKPIEEKVSEPIKPPIEEKVEAPSETPIEEKVEASPEPVSEEKAEPKAVESATTSASIENEEKVSEPIEAPIEEKVEAPINTPIEEPLDPTEETIERAKAFLFEIFDKMHLHVDIDGREAEQGYVLDITGNNLGILIGKHGQTLDALQYIVNLAANGQRNNRIHFVIDVEGYREKRTASLKKLAKTLSDRAIKTRKDVRLEPMSRYERKVIHLTLQENPRVTTHSSGTEPYRYVIISPKKPGEK